MIPYTYIPACLHACMLAFVHACLPRATPRLDPPKAPRLDPPSRPLSPPLAPSRLPSRPLSPPLAPSRPLSPPLAPSRPLSPPLAPLSLPSRPPSAPSPPLAPLSPTLSPPVLLSPPLAPSRPLSSPLAPLLAPFSPPSRPLSPPSRPLLPLFPLSPSRLVSPFRPFCSPFCHLTSLYLSGRGSALCHVWPPSRPLSPSASPSIPLAPMHFSMACVALGDIQSAFACVAHMAPAFLVARLGAVDVTAAAALTSTFLNCVSL